MEPENDAELGRSASAAEVAFPSLAAALEVRDVEKLVNETDWKTHPGVHERLAALQYCYPQAFGAGIIRECPPSESSSMVVSAVSIHPHNNAIESSISSSHGRYSYAPSLGSYSSAESDSVRTSRADSVLLQQHVLEEDENGVMQAPSGHSVVGRLACSFSFLACDYRSDNFKEWDAHSQCHFLRKLPKEVHCPFHCDWKESFASGDEAWSQRTEHIIANHGDDFVDTASRPAKSLIEHFWRIRIIDDAQKKELIRNGRLSGALAYKVSHSRRRDERQRRRF